MKRKLISFMLLVVAVLIFSPHLSGGVITHTATYSANQLTLGTDTLGGMTYSTVFYNGLFNSGPSGAPWLPVEYFKFSVPYNAANFSVTAATERFDNQILDYPVYPKQAWDGNGVTLPDNAYYSASTYPTAVAWVVDEGMLAGENHVVTVAFMPVTCGNMPGITGIRALSLARDVQLTLSYELSDSASVHPLVRKGAIQREEGLELTRNAVVNPEDVAGNAIPLSSPLNQMRFNIDDEPLDSVENPDTYMIIATETSFRPLRRLAALKMQEGYGVKMVTIDDVISDPIVGLGDSVPGVGLVHADDAGKLRQYLRHHYMLRGTEYALLAGTGIPYFYHEGGGADIYFSELNMDWITFESREGELYVGRLFGSASRQFDNYTDKLLRYELNPGNGDFSYLERGLIIESNAFPLQTSTDLPSLPECTVYNCEYEEEFNGNDVINMIKNNHYGYWSTFNKGFPSGISIFEGFEDNDITVTHYLWAIDTVKVAPGVTDTETGNGLNRLDNRDYPMVYISPKGKTIPYSTDYNYNVSINYGESFTMGKDYGGPAYIGSSRNLYSGGERPTLGLLQTRLFSPYTQIGQVFLTAKSKLPYDHPDAIACENLLGDPSLDVWSDQPQQYTGISITRTDNSVTVSGITESSTIVSYHSNDGKTGSCKTSAASVTLTGVSPNSTIMLNKHNFIPYIAPLVLQNTDIEQSQYVFATEVTAGRSVDSGRTSGDVTVKEGTEYEIEASGEVTLAGGFNVELGARFVVQRTSYK